MTQDTPYTLKLDIIEGVDRFAAEGNEDTVLGLYSDWLKHVDQIQQRTADLFVKSKQVDAAEKALTEAGFSHKRIS